MPISRRLLRHRAIDPEDLARNPAAVTTAEECHSVCNLIWLPDPVIRAHARYSLQELFRFTSVEEFCTSWSRSNRIDRDALRREIFGHDASHLLDRALGGVVQEVTGGDGRIDAKGG